MKQFLFRAVLLILACSSALANPLSSIPKIKTRSTN